MNYKEINKNLANKNKIKKLSDEEVRYLQDNSVLHFTANNLLEESHQKDSILQSTHKKNSVYLKTLSLVSQILNENHISFILFKTYKYIDEIVDGDIDLVVKKSDLNKIQGLLTKEGFNCLYESQKKLEITKEGYSKIEPRIDITHHGYCIIKSDTLWQNTEIENSIRRTNQEIDTIAIILNFLYGPKYIKLYDYLLLRSSNWKKIKEIAGDNKITDEINLAESLINESSVLQRKFPIFLTEGAILKFWITKILINNNISYFEKVKHLVFSFYIKYKYKFLGKLHFAHNWNEYK